MSDKNWTLLLLGDESEGIRQFNLTTRVVRYLGGTLAAFCTILLLLSAFLLYSGGTRIQGGRLAHENALLTQELRRFQIRIEGLEESLAQLAEQDGRVRLLAGLEATDEEILEVGIGGPGLATPRAHPLWPMDSTLSKAAFAVEYDLNALERRAQLLAASLSEASDSLLSHRDLLEATPSIFPVAGVLSSRFSNSRYHPIHHRALPHQGVDISAPHGTPILAAAKGTVVKAGWVPGLGNTVEIDHGYGFKTRYGHASKVTVRRGQRVARGDMIAQVGSTGISTSPHLHYEVHVGGRPVNHLNYVIGDVLP
jgi:murein DD-endopeptidase MepM/ murein hydrolase activator NlpD